MANKNSIDISVAICTYKRPLLLKLCLQKLLIQNCSKRFEIIVVDNDVNKSAMKTVKSVQDIANQYGIKIYYLTEDIQNISLARNKAINACEGKLIAFIDDDEYPIEKWLEGLSRTLETQRVDGVFGPVVPTFSNGFPKWQKNSKIFFRKRMKTGMSLQKKQDYCISGNALISKSVLKKRFGPFNPEYGKTGGEDSELFGWLINQGYSFCWCDDAVVFEHQEIKRADIKWHISRGYRSGWVFSKRSCDSKGWFRGGFYVLVRLLPSSFRVLFRTILQYDNLKATALFFFRKMASQVGKIGYFLGWKIEEYKKR